jgi:hypothetical protein
VAARAAELFASHGLTTDGSTLYTRASQWVFANTRVISPTKVNEARFGYNSIFNVIAQELANKEDVDAEIGVPVKITDPNSWGIPNISLSNNLSSFGNATSSPFTIDDKYFQGVDNFSWVHGKHSLRFGGEYRYNKFPQLGNEFPRGQFFFGGQFTGNPNTQGTGYSGADFIQGYMNNAIIAVALVSSDFRNSEWAAYIDDTWKVSPRLTINAGLRWEVAQPMLDVSGRGVNVQLNDSLASVANVSDMSKHPVYVRTGSGNFYDGVDFRYQAFWAAQGQTVSGSPALQLARDGRLGGRLIATDFNNFAPRLGIAWSPSSKWAVRSGFGIFYSQESKNSIFDLNRDLFRTHESFVARQLLQRLAKVCRIKCDKRCHVKLVRHRLSTEAQTKVSTFYTPFHGVPECKVLARGYARSRSQLRARDLRMAKHLGNVNPQGVEIFKQDAGQWH